MSGALRANVALVRGRGGATQARRRAALVRPTPRSALDTSGEFGVSARNVCSRTGVRPPVASAQSPQSSDDTPARPRLLNMRELEEISRRRGMELVVSEIGPLWRVSVRALPKAPEGAQPSTTGSAPARKEEILGFVEGFWIPLVGILHIDKMVVFNDRVRAMGEAGGAARRNALGLGFLLGAASVTLGIERGCKKGELLAIDDDPHQLSRLVRYYGRFGWRAVRQVWGDTLADLPHMLVWGGAGVRMDADLEEILGNWSAAIIKSELSNSK